MTPSEECVSRIERGADVFECYSGLYRSFPRLSLVPSNIEELHCVFAYAEETDRRVTLRAGGHSFDAQSLGDDIVVSMERFDAIEPLSGDRVRVGPGATWGAILAKVEPHGLIPAVTVTTEHATAGGTLSGDCLSRFSPAYGKEGAWVESFELVTPTGRLLNCTPPPDDDSPADWTLEQRAFAGVISGLGFLGAVVSITYKLLPVQTTARKLGVQTTLRKYETLDTLAHDLVPATRQMFEEQSDPNDHGKHDAIYSAVHVGKRSRQAVLFKSLLTDAAERRPMALYQPRLAMRLVVEWLMRMSFFRRLIWWFSFRFPLVFNERKIYINDLEGFAFFMDGNVRAKKIGKRFGFPMKTIQQTFIVPSDPGSAAGWDRARDDLVEWLEYAEEHLRRRGLTPTLHDVLFLPRDRRFLLSASAELAGFAVSYSFETSNKATLGRVERAFSELADTLWEKFRGRVYLVKNVHVDPSTLAAMYGDSALEFLSLKHELDPGGRLGNAFLERIFPDLRARADAVDEPTVGRRH